MADAGAVVSAVSRERAVLQALEGISRLLATQNRSGAIFAAVLRSAAALLGNGSASLYLWDRDAALLRHAQSHGAGGDRAPTTLEKGRTTLAGAVQEQGRPLGGSDGGLPALAVPLRRAGIAVGVLVVRAADPAHRYTEDDARALALLGDQALVAIRMAQTFEEQEATRAELERLGRAKADFTAIIDHEFRTPLTGIQGFSEMLRDEPLSRDEVREYASDINKDAKRLSSLIAELVLLDRMEAGEVELDIGSVDLNAIVREEAAAIGHGTQKRVSLALDPGLPPLRADRERVSEIVRFLTQSASDYAAEGSALELDTKREGAFAHLWVRARRAVLPVDMLERIFDRYARIDPTATRHIRGSGLGLPIARRLAALHGGNAWAETRAGEGATFRAKLPLERAS